MLDVLSHAHDIAWGLWGRDSDELPFWLAYSGTPLIFLVASALAMIRVS